MRTAGPAAAHGAVQRDPGGDALALQADQRGLGCQSGAARVLQFHEAGQAAAISCFRGHERDPEAFESRGGIDHPQARTFEVDQRLFDLANRLPNTRGIERRGLVVAGAGRFHIGGAAAAVEQRHADRDRSDRPGLRVDEFAADAHHAGRDRAGQAQARIALRLRAADVGARGRDLELGLVDVGTLGQQLRRHGQHRQQRRLRRLLPRRQQLAPQVGLGDAAQGDERFHFDLALGALLRRAGRSFGRTRARQRRGRRRGESGAGCQLGQPRGFGARSCVVDRDGELAFAGAQVDVAVGGFRRDRHPRVMPARLRGREPRLGCPQGAGVAAEQVDLPAGLQAGLQRRRQRNGRLRVAAAGAGLGVERGQQRRARRRARGAGLLDA
jgi:hypothetical protein